MTLFAWEKHVRIILSKALFLLFLLLQEFHQGLTHGDTLASTLNQN